MNKVLCLLILIQCSSIWAMKQPASTSALDEIPVELRSLVLNYIAAEDTLNKAMGGLTKFYVASPQSRKSPSINKEILKYLMQKFDYEFENGDVLQGVINRLNKFPVFQNAEMLAWIGKQKEQLDKQQALREAAKQGNVQGVQELINQKVNVNARSRSKDTALINALIYKQYPIAELLLNSGAAPNIINTKGLTALGALLVKYEAAPIQDKILTMLLAKGANPNIGKITFEGNNGPLARLPALRYVREQLHNENLAEKLIRAGAVEDPMEVE